MSAATYIDARAGKTFPLDVLRWCSPDRTPLMVTPLPGIRRDAIVGSIRSLWRYRAALPLEVSDPISLGEGCTPLISKAFNGTPALVKCEWLMPTGSFKDRGASVMLTLLRSQGIRDILEDSSGNGGASVAAYSAAGGMSARIMAPASTSPGKTVQIRAYGAKLELIPGSRADTSAAAERAADQTFYASHNWHPFFLQGTKTLAYELWEDLGFRAPDNIIVPCGAGSNVLGCQIGFGELLRTGEIAVMPRLWAVQPANCAPVAASLAAGSRQPVHTRIERTIAEGTAIANPIRLPEIVDALNETQGGAVTVSDREIAQAVRDLGRSGIYVEPTAAQAAAGFAKLLQTREISANQCNVVVLTGAGLKATAAIAEIYG